MRTTTFCLAIITLLAYARNINSAPIVDEPPSEFIDPVLHVKETPDGYITYKDRQIDSEEEDKKRCIPRDSPEGRARLHLINKQLTETEAGNLDSSVPSSPPEEPQPQPPTLDGTAVPEDPIGDAENLPQAPSRPPFNDTTPFDGVDVMETMELRIYKPLCDY
ncbi:unnamed protein product [Cylicocyclus nassatus]|uniref:Secreted protein n=1 Tax=Cylicocyclus nassatus TaxID=53992 RepID=A0AA36GHR0_CYLNA|nr:unnamed protein product [Cylicocyclus nassatus]